MNKGFEPRDLGLWFWVLFPFAMAGVRWAIYQDWDGITAAFAFGFMGFGMAIGSFGSGFTSRKQSWLLPIIIYFIPLGFMTFVEFKY